MRTPPRSPTRTPLRAKVALAALALVLAVWLVPAAARAQTPEDARVNALSAHVLVTRSPVALVDPVRQRRGRAITDDQQLIFIGWALAPMLAFFWLWQTGSAARWRDVLRRRFGRPWLVRATFGATLGALAIIVMLPFAFASYRVAANVGLSHQPISSWFAEQLSRIGLTAVASAVAVALILALVDGTRLWYLAFIGILYASALVVVAVEPVLLAPLAVPHRPAPARIVALADVAARALGVAPVGVEIATGAEGTGPSPARTSGLGPFTRIVLDGAALARTTPPEHLYVLTRQYAHVKRHDVLWLTLWGTTLFVLAAALAVLISDRIGFRRDDDPLARLALVGTFLGLTALALYPAYTSVERHFESSADRLAIAALGDRADAIRLLVRGADDNLTPICGRRTTRWYFDSRDPIGTRIAALSGRPDPCPR